MKIPLYFLLTLTMCSSFCILFAEISFILRDSYKILPAPILPLQAKPALDGPVAVDPACMVAQTLITVTSTSSQLAQLQDHKSCGHYLVFPHAGPVPRTLQGAVVQQEWTNIFASLFLLIRILRRLLGELPDLIALRQHPHPRHQLQ